MLCYVGISISIRFICCFCYAYILFLTSIDIIASGAWIIPFVADSMDSFASLIMDDQGSSNSSLTAFL